MCTLFYFFYTDLDYPASAYADKLFLSSMLDLAVSQLKTLLLHPNHFIMIALVDGKECGYKNQFRFFYLLFIMLNMVSVLVRSDCAINNNGCEYFCFSTSDERERESICGCPTHYTLNSDKKTCSGM